jgi:2-isopropylmalate synthase
MMGHMVRALSNRAAAHRVLIFDTTLRDGEQSPGATMTHAEKLEIARCSTRWAWTSSRRASRSPPKAISPPSRDRRTGRKRRDLRARARQFKDIDRCWEAVKTARRPRIHTFIGTSPLHRAIPNLTQDEMAERIHATVSHARDLCDNVQWSPMDATRTEWDYLCRVIEIAIAAGATTINIPDTVGYTAPANPPI